MISPPLKPNTYHCRCALCSRSFHDLAAFDRHQRVSPNGDVRCQDPLDRGLVYVAGFWTFPLGITDAVSDQRMASPAHETAEQDLHQGVLQL